ncbi:MAG: CDP-alcohol phosphatidyltransferase family protein [Deltaproteobacteria bacterium]|nr:CDP-alcohol phosphatidyltransferase family protein [Deltaproteobacteria bacterium]
MDFTLIVTPSPHDPRPAIRVAGLSLVDRLAHTARRCGLGPVLILHPHPDQAEPINPETRLVGPGDRPLLSGSKLSIILQNGHLPDRLFLETLLETLKGDFPCLIKRYPAILVMRSDDINKWLPHLLDDHGFEQLAENLKSRPETRWLVVDRGRLYDLTDPRQIGSVEDELFRDLVKDTEGFMSRHFERKISLALSKRLVETAITPNQMTIISVLIGILGAWLIGLGGRWWSFTGALLFLTHSILDGCDGEIARIKFMESHWGGLLDFWGDNVVHVAVFMAIAWAWSASSLSRLPLVLGALATCAALASAWLIYVGTMKSKKEEGPLYTSVSRAAEKDQLNRLADFLSRRDFIYLVVILAYFNQLPWFLILSAVGTPIFFLIIRRLQLKERVATTLTARLSG